MGSGLCSGDPTRYYRANKHAVCPPLSPLDTVGITHPPPLSTLPFLNPLRPAVFAVFGSARLASRVRPRGVCRVASLLTPRALYPISSRAIVPDVCAAVCLIGVTQSLSPPRCRAEERESGTVSRLCLLIWLIRFDCRCMILTTRGK